MNVRNALALFFALLILCEVRSQTSIDIDTFRIDQIPFVVKGESNWFSSMLNDSIQSDTTWNYQMRYSPKTNPTNIYAVIGIQIINNSHYTPTKKEQRRFNKQCTVSEKYLSGRKAYYLDYNPQKVKKCNGCPPTYTKVYSVPISRDKTLNIIFFAQAHYVEILPLIETYRVFANRFVKENTNQLTSLTLMNLIAPMKLDTFHVSKYYLHSLTPVGYNKTICKSRVTEIRKFGYCISNSNDEFNIRVSASYYTPADSLAMDVAYDDTLVHAVATPPTRISQSSFGEYAGYGLRNNTLKTNRLIKLADGAAIVLEFYCEYGYEDYESTVVALTQYADMVKQRNIIPHKMLDIPFLQPLKIEFDHPGGAKPGSNKSGTLPRPK